MIEEKVIIISQEEQEKLNFNAETGKCFPQTSTGGGMRIPHTPSDFERNHCGFAPEGYNCSGHQVGRLGGPIREVRCGECPYHPSNRRY